MLQCDMRVICAVARPLQCCLTPVTACFANYFALLGTDLQSTCQGRLLDSYGPLKLKCSGCECLQLFMAGCRILCVDGDQTKLFNRNVKSSDVFQTVPEHFLLNEVCWKEYCAEA